MRSVLSNMPYANNKSANQTFRFIDTIHVIYAKFGDSSSLLYLARMDGILYWKKLKQFCLTRLILFKVYRYRIYACVFTLTLASKVLNIIFCIIIKVYFEQTNFLPIKRHLGYKSIYERDPRCTFSALQILFYITFLSGTLF